MNKIAGSFDISVAELLSFPDDKKIVDADVVVLGKAIEILKQILEIAKNYKLKKY